MVYRNAGEVFGKNRLHPGIQSAVDGKRQRLETFRNKLADARRRGFHFEQVRSLNVARRQSYERNEKSADRQTDGFSSLYSREKYILTTIDGIYVYNNHMHGA